MLKAIAVLFLLFGSAFSASADVVVCRAEWEDPVTKKMGQGEWVSANVIFIEIDWRKKLYPEFIYSFSCKRLYDV